MVCRARVGDERWGGEETACLFPRFPCRCEYVSCAYDGESVDIFTKTLPLLTVAGQGNVLPSSSRGVGEILELFHSSHYLVDEELGV